MSTEILLLERELLQVLGRYARACDERDWAAMKDVFLPDCVADYGTWHCSDRAAIVAMIRQHLDGCGPTQHLLGNLLVHATGDTVTSRIYVRAGHRGKGEYKPLRYDALGEYMDEWTHTSEGWRISRRQMKLTLEIGDRRVLQPQ